METREVTRMANRIRAAHRWAVTGTPLGPHCLADLYGLLQARHCRRPWSTPRALGTPWDASVCCEGGSSDCYVPWTGKDVRSFLSCMPLLTVQLQTYVLQTPHLQDLVCR
jgi:SNF2-related domain